MERDIKRRENETELSYMARMYRNKIELGLNNKEINELINKELGTHYAESTTRCNSNSFNQGYNEALENKNDDEYLKKLEEKTRELEIMKIQYQDQRREYRNHQRPDARFQHILDEVKKLIDNLNEIKPFEFTRDCEYIPDDNVEAVLTCSDWHLFGEVDNYFNKYNIDIAKERLETLLNKTIAYCKFNRVNTLNVELLGDNIMGGIHWGSKIEASEDTMSQIMDLCEILFLFIHRLCEKIPNVVVRSVIGNHSRINMDKKNNQNGENLERLIPRALKWRTSGKNHIDNLTIDTQCNIDDTIIMYDVLGTTIIGLHGDLDKPSDTVNNMVKMFKGVPIDEIHTGHLHHDFVNEEYDIEYSINGSLMGVDTYAKSIRKTGSAMQKLRIYTKEGQLCSYKIKLN